MASTSVIVKSATGIHTRPATIIAKKAKEFQCNITLKHESKTADAKSMLQIMKLQLAFDATVDIICEGVDDAEALIALVEVFSSITE